VDFVKEQTIVFVRLENAIELLGMLEIKLYSRFIVLLIGPEENERQLLQIGRAMATILTDDICREFAYVAKSPRDVMQMMDRFMHDTYVIPPSEWDPSIRIEPPSKYTSKVGNEHVSVETEPILFDVIAGRTASSSSRRKSRRNRKDRFNFSCGSEFESLEKVCRVHPEENIAIDVCNF
jgi:hypothetical protein